MFGDSEVKLSSLTDAAGIFRRHEREVISRAQAKFSEVFPQLFVAVYTGNLGGTGNLRQFGFWLLNQGLFEDIPLEKPNEAGLLLVIDPDSKAAGMTFGYLLDPFIDEQDTFECLSRAHSYWLEGRYAEGVMKSLKHLDSMLKKRCKLARRDPEKYERKVASPVAVEELVKKIRSGKPAGHASVEKFRDTEVER